MTTVSPPSSRFPVQPIRVDDRISITTLSSAYTDDLARVANNPNVARYLTGRFPSPYTIEDAEAFIKMCGKDREEGELTNVRRSIIVDGAFAGGVGLRLSTDPMNASAIVGYWLGEEYWGQGIMTKVVAKFVDLCFKSFPQVNHLDLDAFSPNKGSQRVAEKTGFSLEGVRRSAYAVRGDAEGKGGCTDVVLYGLLRSEWEQQRSAK